MSPLTNAKSKLLIVGLLVFSFTAAGCPPKGSVKKGGASPADGTDTAGGRDGASAADGVAINDDMDATDVEEARIRGKEFVPATDLKTIRFNFDAYSLSTEARLALRENAAYLKSNPSLEVLVEGHCDDRGTNEYNLALGQKRAKAVRDYYMRLGVSGRSIATISFGEERLECEDASESCWGTNRRAVTKIRAQVSSTTHGGSNTP